MSCLDITVTTLSRTFSDHSPLIIKSFSKDFRSSPLRVFNAWLEVDGCKHMVSDSQKGWNPIGSARYERLVSRHRSEQMRQILINRLLISQGYCSIMGN